MAQIDNIVTVNITRGTTAIDVRSFSIPLLLVAAGEYTGNRVTTHTSVDSVAGMFTENHSAYRMAQALLSGDTKPSTFKIAVVWGEREVEGKIIPAETYAEAFVAALQEDDEAYALVVDSKQDGDILALAKEVQARDMIYFSSTSNPDSLDPNDETSVGYLLKESGYDQTALLYSEVAETAHPEVVWVGGNIAKTVGSLTWEYKKLPTVPVSSKLSDSDIHTLQQKNINYYIRVKGANITRRGKMTEGVWIDEVQIIHWLKARIQERVFFRLINNDKIPYTAEGVSIIEAEIRRVFGEAIANGAIADYTLQVPNVYDIPEIDRVNRELGNFRFEARLAGAVSTVKVIGNVHA